MATRRQQRSRASSAYAIPNQVFLAIPWRTVRPKYDRVIDDLKSKFPTSFVIVGREEGQEAEDLLEIIKDRLLSSSYAIFDATNGNANVSLEFGFAEAHDIPRALYVSTHRASRKGSDAPIIADLAGKRRNQYAQERALARLLREFCSGHPYNKRFQQFLRENYRGVTGPRMRSVKSLALKIIHQLDGSREVRRADIVQNLLADPSRYKRRDIDQMILRLHREGLIRSQQGPFAKVQVA